MRRIALAALLLPGIVLFAGCNDRDTSQPVEPSFAKVSDACDTQTALYDHVVDGIEALFDTRQAKKAAKDHIDNIYREVCQDPADYDAARQHLNSFVQQVDGQPDDKLAQNQDAFAELVNWAILLATEIPFEIPAGAFASSGALGIVDPALGGSLITRNGNAAVNLGAVGGDPVVLALSLSQDPLTFGSHIVMPPTYEVYGDLGSLPGGTLENGAVLVQLCVDTELLESGVFDRLLLGHGALTGAELLARVPDAELTIQCTPDVGTQTASSETGWLGHVTRLARAAARKMFGPEPLRAMYFGASGLGGRPISFSPFAPVDPYTLDVAGPAQILVTGTGQMVATLTSAAPAAMPVPEDPEFGWFSSNESVATVDGSGLVTGLAEGGAWIRATYPGLADSSWVEVVAPPRTLTVTVAVETPGTLTVTDGNGNTCWTDEKKSEAVTCTWTYPHGTSVVLTASVPRKIMGSWDISVTGALEETVQVEESVSFPAIAMTGPKDIAFTLLH